MAHPDQTLQPIGRTAALIAPGAIYLLVLAICAGVGAYFVKDQVLMTVLISVAGSFLLLAVLAKLAQRQIAQSKDTMQDALAAFIAHDASPSFTTDAEGEIGAQNRAAIERFGSRSGQTLARALGELFANPGAMLARLQSKAEALGAAREDLVTRRGHVRLSVHRVDGGGYLWRLEDMAERAVGGRGGETLSLPMLTVSKNGTILFMNEALRRLVGERVRTLDRIFTELPIRSGEEQEITTSEGPVRCMVAQIEGAGGRDEIYLMPVAPGRPATHDPAAFESLPVALMRLNVDGRVFEVNRAARGLLGQIAPGSRLCELFEGLGRPVEDWVADAVAGRTDRRPEVLRAHRGDREVFLQVTLSRVIEEGRAGLIAVLSDATQLKTLEGQFVQSQKMQAIGQLAGGVAHDFNNLLTAISGHCDLLMLRHEKGDPDYTDLDQISQNANRAASLVGQLLAFSRKQTLKPRIMDLRDTLSDLTHLLNRLTGEKIMLTLMHDPGLALIRADRRQLEQVIMNLVVNARDAMPGGGEIRIETENMRLLEDLKRDRAAVPKGDYVVVKVTDEGVGISPDKLGKIFEPFFTTKKPGEGTGLGLSTAYGIVKQTGGYIFCDSVLGSGTSFTLFLPAHGQRGELEPEPTVTPMDLPQIEENPTSKVLLVEDEAPVRAFASRALKLRGYTVFEAENAEEALRILEDESLSFDVFVTDVIMPGMDGPTWVAEALKARPDVPVVFVSGYAEDVFREGRPPMPNSVFLPKPFSLSELTATVQNQIARRARKLAARVGAAEPVESQEDEAEAQAKLS
ncbi:two-component system cell cycle sensor histidine kinase/response regulator CckA [Rhodobacter sp. JA431]|nr:two-component system cell cycle sensor histidine kinase/response regulator CckA [Rhodobacter sp. JA431]